MARPSGIPSSGSKSSAHARFIGKRALGLWYEIASTGLRRPLDRPSSRAYAAATVPVPGLAVAPVPPIAAVLPELAVLE